MAYLHLDELTPDLFGGLKNRAAASGRTIEEEAESVLETVLRSGDPTAWESVAKLRERLGASGRTFGDSAELVREDRDR